MAAARVLVVEDEAQILRSLTVILRSAGYEVTAATTAREALERAVLRPPDAVLLDLRLPDGDGETVCRSLREWCRAPIVVVSAVGDEGAKIDALDAGADDYVTKPYAAGELLARLRAVMRRAAAAPGEQPLVRFGDVELDLGRRVVRRLGRVVPMPAHEYGLLATLAGHPGRVFTHRALLRAVWGPGYERETQYLRVYMLRLRKKLEPDPSRPRHLITETGIGYRLETLPD
jgi:two-component system, OmpR family, KDP operon response regulator KdpE